MSEERNAAIVDMVIRQEFGISFVAKKYGLSRQAIQQIVMKETGKGGVAEARGFKVQGDHPIPPDVQRTLTLYHQHPSWTIDHIAERQGIPYHRAYARLRNHGLPCHDRSRSRAIRIRDRKRKLDILRLWEQGMSGPQIAREIGCAASTVYRRLDQAGIERRRYDTGKAKT